MGIDFYGIEPVFAEREEGDGVLHGISRMFECGV